MPKKRGDPGRVDTDAARMTVDCPNVQEAWNVYVLARLRRGISPGCDMRDLGAWWDQQRSLRLPREEPNA
jgi:endogenous inhibitor of DNA gyrase (YacG/DUF329 family)